MNFLKSFPFLCVYLAAYCSVSKYLHIIWGILTWSPVLLHNILRKYIAWLIFFNVLRLVLWPVIWSVLEKFPRTDEKWTLCICRMKDSVDQLNPFVLLSAWALFPCWASVSSICHWWQWGAKVLQYYFEMDLPILAILLLKNFVTYVFYWCFALISVFFSAQTTMFQTLIFILWLFCKHLLLWFSQFIY